MAASASVGGDGDGCPSRPMPRKSPSAIGPTSHVESRTARVTSPATTFVGRLGHASTFSSTSASGSYVEQGGEALGDPAWSARPARSSSVRPSTCSATGMMFLLLGRMHDLVGRHRLDRLEQLAVDGFIDWPPATTPCTPSEWKIRRMPSPVATATTAVVTGSAGARAASRRWRRPRGPSAPPRPARAGR